MGRECIEMGKNVEALEEKINGISYITFKNDSGEPVLIFSQSRAAFMRFAFQFNKPQIVFRTHIYHYILTFSDCLKAEAFSEAFVNYVKDSIQFFRLHANVGELFEHNKIKVKPTDG